MKLYKLTDKDSYTRRGKHNETLWGEGITHTAKGEGGLCSDGVIHAYDSPLLAILLNPNHAGIENPIIWEAEGDITIRDWAKIGCKTLTTICKIKVPEITIEQRITFAILCAKEVYTDVNWLKWADNWLNGKDRSQKSAYFAYTAIYATNADYFAYATSAANAAASATDAASSDSYSADYTAVNADYAVVNSATYASLFSKIPIDFHALAEKAIVLGFKPQL
jgi:hypothetical protein